METNFKIGDWLRLETTEWIFCVADFTQGRKNIPDGWLVTEDGSAINPEFCEPYKGATSVLMHRPSL